MPLSGQATPETTVPGAPTIGRATPGNAQATATFTPPGSDGGSPVIFYTATATDHTDAARGGQKATGAGSPLTVTGLTNGDTYTFTVTATNKVGTGPASAPSNAVVPGPPPPPHALIVSELRLAGPVGSSDDEYAELYNTTGAPLSTSGWSLVYGVNPGTERSIALPAVMVPAAGHLLVTGSGYSLVSYAASDTGGLAASADQGVRVMAGDGTVTDAVGMTGSPPDLHAGTPLTVPVQTRAQSDYVRVYAAGVPVDTNNNAADFRFVATDVNATIDHGTPGATLGAPGPAGLASSVNANAFAPSTLLDPKVAASAPPNRSYDPTTKSLVVRRTITNTSKVAITSLRLRITGMTTYGNTTPSQAILELTSSAQPGGIIDGYPIAPTTLDAPPSAPARGGLDSSVTVTLPPGGLAPGASINIGIGFHVVRGGSFSFAYNVEASTS